MQYLIKMDYKKFKIADDELELAKSLAKATKIWCDDMYRANTDNPEPLDLFIECLEGKDFGNIASVYKIDSDDSEGDLEGCEVGDIFELTRIL